MKIDRLLGILIILLKNDMVTAPMLAEHFEVSRRTINRDLEDLCKAGIPVVTIQGCVYMGSVSVVSEHMDDMAHQAPPSTGIPRRGYWSGQPFPPPGDLSHSGIKPTSPGSPILQVDSLPLHHLGSPAM